MHYIKMSITTQYIHCVICSLVLLNLWKGLDEGATQSCYWVLPHEHNIGCVSSWAVTKVETQDFVGCRQWHGGWMVSTKTPGAAGTRWGNRETGQNRVETISVGVKRQRGWILVDVLPACGEVNLSAQVWVYMHTYKLYTGFKWVS